MDYEQTWDGRVFSVEYMELLLKQQAERGPNPVDEDEPDYREEE